MTHLQRHDSFICVTWVMCVPWVHVSLMTYSCVIRLILTRDMTHLQRRDSFICVTWVICVTWAMSHIWLIHMCNTTHSYTWHDSFTCVKRLILESCHTTHSHTWHDSFTWLIHECDMTYSYVWHDSFICVTWLIHPYVWLTHLHVSYDSSYDSFTCVIRSSWEGPQWRP